jgi:hypothetical protein
MAGRLDDLDALSTFERTALPLLVGRWQSEGRDLSELPVVRGLHRRMVVRNRMVLHGARAALERLDAAGIDAMPLKSAALVGRILPERGLRPLADVDLWVRPSVHAAAVRLLARPDPRSTSPRSTDLRSTGAAAPDPHARMVRDAAGRELDLHRLPSHLFARRGGSRIDAERRFDRTWDRRVDGRAPLADILHHTLVNVLFSHAPGEARAAFALIELDTALRHPDVSDETLDALITLAVEDRTATILVEHLDRLGPGVSAPLDRLLHDHLEPALTPDDRALRTWMADQPRQHGTPATFPTWLRQAVHTHQRVPQHTRTIAGWLLRTEAQDLRRTPWVPHHPTSPPTHLAASGTTRVGTAAGAQRWLTLPVDTNDSRTIPYVTGDDRAHEKMRN